MDFQAQSYLFEGIRTLFLLGVPVLVAASVAGLLVAALQAATTIRDPASSYAARLLAVLVTCYLLAPTCIDALKKLLLSALG